jgi:hypothetical protein
MTTAATATEQGPLAMICGGGSLPLAVAESVARSGRKVVLFPLRGAADGLPVERFKHYWIYIGQFGKLFRTARAEQCRDMVFIGSLVRPSIWHTHPDLGGLRLLTKVIAAYRGGDNHLLSGLARLIEGEGFRLVGAHEVAPEILVPEGALGRVQPSEEDRADIAFGLEYLNATGRFDVGQAVVVGRRHIWAVEATEGTDQMVERVVQMRANGRLRAPSGTGVLVKSPKPGQDHRFDLPSIGPLTVEGVARAGLAGIAVAAGTAIVAEPEKLTAAADRAKVFVIGVAAEQAT